MKTPSNAICPCCGEQGQVERLAAGREWWAGCDCGRGLHAFGATAIDAVDRWQAVAERAVLRGAA